MPIYRLYFIEKTGRIVRAMDLAAEDDAQAIREATHKSAGAAAELWLGKRRVKVIPAASGGE